MYGGPCKSDYVANWVYKNLRYFFSAVPVGSGHSLYWCSPCDVDCATCLDCQEPSPKYNYEAVRLVCSSHCFQACVSNLPSVSTDGTHLPQLFFHGHRRLDLQKRHARFKPCHVYIAPLVCESPPSDLHSIIVVDEDGFILYVCLVGLVSA